MRWGARASVFYTDVKPRVPQAEWVETTHPGYGARMGYQVDMTYFSFWGYPESAVYTDAMWQKTGELLPWLA